MWSKYSNFPQKFDFIYFGYSYLSLEWQAVLYFGGAGFKFQPVDRVNSLRVCMVFFRSSMKYSGVCYNERMLQRTVFVKIIMLKRKQMLQRMRRNTIGRRSTRVRMTYRAFPLWLERQSSSFFIVCKVKLSVQFSYLLICTVYKC
jgi:hypothetical protein